LPIITSSPVTSDEITHPRPQQKITIQSRQPAYQEKAAAPRGIEEKSPLLALFCSLIIPGLGQVYNGKTARGIGIFLGSLFGLILIIPGIIVWIYGMYDAYSMAKKMNAGEIQFLSTKTAHLILFIILAIIVGIIGISLIVGFYSSLGSASTNSQFSGLSIDQIKSQAQNISYTDLMHSPDAYKNTIVYFRGQIIQEENEYGNTYILRIATKQEPYVGYTDDIIYVDYSGSQPVQGDVVDVYGNFVGLKTYTAVLGNTITIPEINNLFMTIITEKT
jgi:TM2 domain-containing membrane protein YozV